MDRNRLRVGYLGTNSYLEKEANHRRIATENYEYAKAHPESNGLYIGDDRSKQDYLQTSKPIDAPENYGVVDWMKDTWSQFFQSMNESQANDFAGQYQRAQEKRDIIQGAKEEIQNDIKLGAITDYFDHKRKAQDTSKDLETLSKLYPDLQRLTRSQIEKFLLSEQSKFIRNQTDKKNHTNYDLLLKDSQSSGMGVLADLKHKLGISIHSNDETSNGVTGYMQDWIGDRVNDASGYISGIDGVSNAEKLQMLDKYDKQLSDVQKYSLRAKEANDKESKWYENAHKVSKYYKDRIARSQQDMANGGSMWTADNLLFANTQQMGFSSSSWDKLGTSMLLSLGAALATGGGSTAMQLTGAGLGVAGGVAQYQAGTSENNAEVVENLKTRIKNQLSKNKDVYSKIMSDAKSRFKNKSEDEILEMISRGDYMPETSKGLASVRKAITESLAEARKGSNAVFDRDMYAVASDAMFDTVLYAGSGLKGIGSAIAKFTNTGAVLKPVKEAGKWILQRGKGASSAFDAGMKAGLGIPGGVAGVVLKTGANATNDLLRLTPKGGIIRNGIAWAEKEVAAGRKFISKQLAKTHKEDLIKDNLFLNRLRKYVKTPLKGLEKVALSGYSESIEEGKQFENAQSWIENENPERVVGFFDGVMRDALLGQGLIIPALGVPFGQRWGIEDKGELYSNMAGGWLGGAMHTAMISGGSTAISAMSTPDRISISDMIALNAELGRNEALSRYTKGAELAELALNNPKAAMRELEEYRKFNAKRREMGLSNLDDSVLDEEERYIKLIHANSVNPDVQEQLDDAGIDYKSKDWYNAISALTMYQNMAKEDKDQIVATLKNIDSRLNEAWKNQTDQDEADEILNSTIFGEAPSTPSLVKLFIDESKKQNAVSEAKKSKDRTEHAQQLYDSIRLYENTQREYDDAIKNSDTEKAQELKQKLDADEKQYNRNISAFNKMQDNDTEKAQQAISAFGTNTDDASLFKSILQIISEIAGLQELRDNINVADEYSEKKTHHDVNYFNAKINDRIAYIKKRTNISDEKLQKVLEHPESYVDEESWDELKSLHQRNMCHSINRSISQHLERLITGDPKNLRIDKETKKYLYDGWHLSKAKDVIARLNRSVDSSDKLVDKINMEYEQEVTGVQPTLQPAQQFSQPQLTTAPTHTGTANNTDLELDYAMSQMDNAILKLVSICELSEYVDLELDANNMIDPELDEIGSAIMHASFMSNKYSWKDAVEFAHNALKDRLTDKQLKQIIPFFKQWYMSASVNSVYDNVGDKFSNRQEVSKFSAQSIIDSLTFDPVTFVNNQKSKLGLDNIFMSADEAFVDGEAFSTEFKVGDKFGVAEVSDPNNLDVVVHTVIKVDNEGHAIDIDDEFGLPVCRDGKLLTQAQIDALINPANNVQNDVATTIINKVAELKKNIVGKPTSRVYFIKENDGKIHMYDRSTYVVGRQYEDEESKKEARTNAFNQILALLKNKKYDELKNVSVEYDENHNKYAKEVEYKMSRSLADVQDLQRYIDFLKQYPDPSLDDIINVARHLSYELTSEPYTPGLAMWSIITDITKAYFNTNPGTIRSLDYNTFTANVNGKDVLINTYMTKEQFDSFIEDLSRIKYKYQNKLKYKLIVPDGVVYTKLIDPRTGGERRIAGELKILGVDEAGKTHIIDIATSSYTYMEKIDKGQTGQFYAKNPLHGKYESFASNYELKSKTASLLAQALKRSIEGIELAEHPLETIAIRTKYNWKGIQSNMDNPIDKQHPGVYELFADLKHEPYKIPLNVTTSIFGDELFVEAKEEELVNRLKYLNQSFEKALDTFSDMSKLLQDMLDGVEYDSDEYHKIEIVKSSIDKYLDSLYNVQERCLNISIEEQIDLLNNKLIDARQRYKIENQNISDLNQELIVGRDGSNTVNEELNEYNKIATLKDALLQTYEGFNKLDPYSSANRSMYANILKMTKDLLASIEAFEEKYPNTKFTALLSDIKNTIVNIKNIDNTSYGHVRVKKRDGYGYTNYNTIDLNSQNKKNEHGISLSDVCGEPEFAEESVCEITGKVFQSRYNVGETLIPVTITYKGEKFNVYLRVADGLVGSDFLIKVNQAFVDKKDGESIILTGMDRMVGIPHQADEFTNVMDSMLVPKGSKLSDIKMDESLKEGNRTFNFYLSKHQVRSDNSTPVVLVTGKDMPVYQFPDVIVNQLQVHGGTAGKIYVRMTPDYRNKTMTPDSVIIPIQNTNLEDKEVNILLDLFKKKLSDRITIKNKKGNNVDTGITVEDVISLFIPYGRWDRTKPATRVLINGSIITFTYGVDGQSNVASQQFDMSSDSQDNGLPTLINYLKESRFHINADIIYENTKKGDFKVFKKLNKFFKDHKEINEISFGRVKFERSDFENGGISGLAWMMKNGMLMTDTDKLVGPRFSYNDVQIEKASIPESVAKEVVEGTAVVDENYKEENWGQLGGIEDYYADDEYYGGDASIDFAPNADQAVVEERVLKNIDRILGNVVPVEVVDNVKNLIQKLPPGFAGMCYRDLIMISTHAVNGTEYHEAFHRIYRLLLTEKLRNNLNKGIRKAYAKVHGEARAERATVDDLNEFAAIRCQRYLVAKEKIEFNLRKPFDFIRQHWRAYKMIGSFRLYRMYMAMNNGKYRNQDILAENKDQLRVSPDASVQVRGVTYQHIVSKRQYDTIIRSMFYYLQNAFEIEPDFSNINDLDLSKEAIQKVRKIHVAQRFTIKKDKNGRTIDEASAFNTYNKAHNKKTRVRIGDIKYKFNKDTKKFEKAYDVYEKSPMQYMLDHCGNEKAKLATEEMFEHWDEVKKDLVAYMKEIGVDYKNEFDVQYEQMLLDGAEGLTEQDRDWLDVLLKDTFETSHVNRASSSIKRIFSTIRRFHKNKLGYDCVTYNECGYSEYMDYKEALNTVFSDCQRVKKVSEIMDIFKRKSGESRMYSQIYELVLPYYKRMNHDADAEQFITLLFNLVANTQNRFKVALANKTKQGYIHSIKNCGQEYDALEYRQTWGRMLTFGRNGYFDKNKNGYFQFKNQEEVNKLQSIYDTLEAIRGYFNSNLIDACEGKYEDIPELIINIPHLGIKEHRINPMNKSSMEIFKRDLCMLFGNIGIQLSVDELDFILNEKLKEFDTLLSKLYAFLNGSGHMSMQNLWSGNKNNMLIVEDKDGNKISNIDEKGLINGKIPVESVYRRNSFAIYLADCKYEYVHKKEDLAVLVTKDKRYYTVSENNFITDVTDELCKGGDIAKQLSKYCFNVYLNGDDPEGSIILTEQMKTEAEGKHLDLNVCTLAQFKTDEAKNEGHDYFDISEVEDYLLKANILRDGHIVFPTMSDKKTWVYLDGITLPGIRYNERYVEKEGKYEKQLVAKVDFDEALDQLVQYAESEYRSVKQTIEQLKELKNHPERKVVNFHQKWIDSRKYDNIDDMVKVFVDCGYVKEDEVDDLKSWFESQIEANKNKRQFKISRETKNGRGKLVVNKNKKGEITYNVSVDVPNGCTFGSFNGIYDENNNYISFNVIFDKDGKFITPELNLKNFEKAFFNHDNTNETDDDGNIVSYGKRAIVARAIEVQLKKALKHAEKLGLIVKENGLYKNKGFDFKTLETLAQTTPDGALDPNNPIAQDKAIKIFLKDVTLKSIMSINEIERVYSGNPAFFKFQYGTRKDGSIVLKNRSADEFKRLGGLISTGTNNNTEIKGMPADGNYNCAIIRDIETSSQQQELIDKMMSESEWRSTYISMFKDKDKNSEIEYLPETEAEIKRRMAKAKALDVDPDTLRPKIERHHSFVDMVQSMSIEEIKKVIKTESDLESSMYHGLYEIIEQKIKDETESYHDHINVADGAAYISPEMTEWLLRMCGNYDKSVLLAFKILKDPKSSIHDQQKAYKLVTTRVIGAQKYTAYGQRMSEDEKLMIPYYNKMALFPVFKCIATGKFLRIYQRMQNNKDEFGNPAPVHMLMMESAVKIGAQGIQDYSNWTDYDESDRAWEDSIYGQDDFRFNTFKQPFAFLRKQFNTDPHHQEEQSMGTQMVKVALASLIQDQIYINSEGQEIRGHELLDQIMEDINSMADEGYDKIYKEFFNEEGDLNLVKFSAYLHKNLTTRDSDKSLTDAISLVKRGDEWQMNHPLSATSRVAWLQSILVSHINKEVIDVKTKGSAFYLRSIFGMEGDTIVTDSNIPPSINNGNKLKMIIEDGPGKGAMDCVLTIDYFADILEKAGLKDASFEEQKQALINSGIIGPNAKASLIGYRIPTLALSSIHPLRCVDVLPVIQHTIILPEEFTKITGSDFDIDKIFIGSLDYDVTEERLDTIDNVKNLKHYSRTGAVGYESSEKAIFIEKKDFGNRLINNYITVLTNEHGAHIAHRSIDNDTNLITDLLKKIEANVNKDNDYEVYDFYALHTQTSTKNEFLTGKTGIGPFALNNNSQILTMLYNVSFAKDSVMDRLYHASLHESIDDHGRSIMSWISALINAHVDIAKDSYITRLNVNPMTYNLTNLLIRTGYGDTTFYFLTQPVMKKMAEEYAKSLSEFMKEPGMSMYEVRKNSKRKAAVELCGEDNVKWAESLLLNEHGTLNIKKKKGVVLEDAAYTVNSILTKDSLDLIDISTGEIDKTKMLEIEDPRGNMIEVTYEQYQALVYVIDSVLERPANKLADVVKYSKIDTKKQGKNITEQLAYARGVRDTFGDDTIMNEMFGDYKKELDEILSTKNRDLDFDENLKVMYEKSFIKHKTHKAIGLFFKIIKDQVLESTPSYQRLVLRMATLLGKEDNDNAIASISQAIGDKLKSKYFIKYAQDNNISVTGLVSGPNSIYDRLLDIQYAILNNERGYEHLRDTDGSSNNALLKLLISDKYSTYNPIDHNGASEKIENFKFVRLFNSLDIDSAKTDLIIQAWEDLLNDSNEDVKKFARDLCVYAFFTSGESRGKYKLFNFVPNKFRTLEGIRDEDGCDQSYVEFISELLFDLQNPLWCNENLNQEFVDDIVLNNHSDYSFVKSLKYDELEAKDEDGNDKWIVVKDKMEGGYPFAPMFAAAGWMNKFDAPMYISIKRDKDSKYDDYNTDVVVYKRVAFRQHPKDDTKIMPVYVKTNPRDYNVGGYRFFLYGDVYNETEAPEMDIVQDLQKYMGMPLLDNARFENWKKLLTMLLNFRGGNRIERAIQAPDSVYSVNIDTSSYNNTPQDANDYEMYSGGAHGADTSWDSVGREFGMKKFTHFRPEGNDMLHAELGRKVKATVVSNAELAECRRKVYNVLGVELEDTLADNLKARDYLQVSKADAVFAIAKVKSDGQSVSGGTNVAVQLAINENKPVYVWDVNSEQWMMFDQFDREFKPCETPRLTKKFAGIGTRDIENYKVPDGNGGFKFREAYVGDEKRNKALQAIRDVYAKTFAKTEEKYEVMSISDKTVDFGVELSSAPNKLIQEAHVWLQKHPNGIVAYRMNGNKASSFTPATVDLGWIGNPFNWTTNYKPGQAVQYFYDWLVKGDNHGEANANEEFRQAVINKILSTDKSEVFYYKELGYPSHATVIGYLINNKLLLRKTDTTPTEYGLDTLKPEEKIQQDTNLDEPTTTGTVAAMNSTENPEFSPADNVLKEKLGGKTLKVVMASEHTDPAFHSKRVCLMINDDLAKPKGERQYHMLQIMTKHDGLPLLDMLELNIPKSVHFSITSLGGTRWEPGVMKTDDLLDRIEDLINRKKLIPATTTIRIDPIIPGVTKLEDIEHIMQRMLKIGLKNIKVSVMDSYGYDERSKKREVLDNMTKLGYDFDKYYNKYVARTTTYDNYGNVKQIEGETYYMLDAKPEIMSGVYQAVDKLAEKYGMFCTTCGEKPNTSYQFKRLKFAEGCLNATGVANVLGVSKESVEQETQKGNQRPGKCNCLNNKSDILAYNDTCASQCAYCYAEHGSDSAMRYYNADGTLIESAFTRTSRDDQKQPSEQPKSNEPLIGPDGLTNEQRNAKNNVLQYISDTKKGKSQYTYASVIGKAGTGKTYTVRHIIEEWKKSHGSGKIAIAAVSRQAVHVLGDLLKDLGVALETTFSLSQASYGGELKYGRELDPENSKIRKYSIVFIDECSMITDEYLNYIDEVKKLNPRVSIIFLGDQGLIRGINPDDNKGKSPIFSRQDVLRSDLTVRIRQGEDSNILPFADRYWDVSTGKSQYSTKDNLKSISSSITSKGALLFLDESDFMEKALPAFREAVETKNPNHIQIVTGTNRSVHDYNSEIHDALFPNSQDGDFANGELIVFNDPYNAETPGNKNFGIDNSQRAVVLEKLESETMDFSYYSPHLGKITVEKYKIKIGNNDQIIIKRINPKDETSLLTYQMVDSFLKDEARYYQRQTKSNAKWKEVWAFQSKFANVDYAYAVTVHKAQGSTYDMVIVNENNISGVQGGWSNQEKAEIIYTAITRAKHLVVMLSSKPADIEVERYQSDMTTVKSEKIDTSTDTTFTSTSNSTTEYGRLSGMQEGVTYTAEQMFEILKKMPSYKSFPKFSQMVFDAAKKLGVVYKVDNNMKPSGRSSRTENVVYININKMNEKTILHETIHQVVNYWVLMKRDAAPENIRKAITELEAVYEGVVERALISVVEGYLNKSSFQKEEIKEYMKKVWAKDPKMYGLSSFTEFIAEFSNKELHAMLKVYDSIDEDRKSILDRVIDAVSKLLQKIIEHISPEYKSVYTTASKAVGQLITTVDPAMYNKCIQYHKMSQTADDFIRDNISKTMIIKNKDMFDSVKNSNQTEFELTSPSGKLNESVKPGCLIIINADPTSATDESSNIYAVIIERESEGTAKYKVVRKYNIANNAVIDSNSGFVKLVDYEIADEDTEGTMNIEKQSLLDMLNSQGEEYLKNC